MYDTTDPRSALNAPAKSSVPPPTEFAAAEYAKFYQTKPQEDDKNARRALARRPAPSQDGRNCRRTPTFCSMKACTAAS